MPLQRILTTLLVATLFLTSRSGFAAEGDLSLNFGVEGTTLVGVPNLEPGQVRLAMLPDGQLLLAGTIAGVGGHDILVARLKSNGELDTTFGQDGIAVVDWGGDDSVGGIAADASARAVVAGTRLRDGESEVGVFRLDQNGLLDPGLDGDGRRIFRFGAASTAAGVTIDLIGRILITGSRINEAGSTIALARLQPGGEFDLSFDGNGKRIIDFGLENGSQSEGAAAAVGDDSRILIVGTRRTAKTSDFAVARILDNGSFDTDFGGNGKIDFDFGGADEGFAAAVSPDARLFVGGVRHGVDDDFAIAALRADGTPALGFTGNGKAVVDFGANESVEALSVMADGRIVAAGTRTSPTGINLAVTRLLVDGVLDNTFDNDGKVRFAPADGNATGNGVAIQPGGRIVGIGTSGEGDTAALLAVGFESFLDIPVGVLEIPGAGSAQSGIGLVSGWVCDAERVAVRIDGQAPLRAAHGTPRGDTATACGDSNNGFGLLFNWALLGDGVHVVRAFADGIEFDRSTFSVKTLGVPFLRGIAATFDLPDFPSTGASSRVSWQQSVQGFVIDGFNPVAAIATLVHPGPATPLAVRGVLEIPQPGAAMSGIGLISGWICDAGRIEIELDGSTLLPAAYGTSRGDTSSECGDDNNGFGLLFNWALLGDGAHTLRALADGTEFGRATVDVTTFGLPFLRGVSGRFVRPGFPDASKSTTIEWSEARQGFALTAVE